MRYLLFFLLALGAVASCKKGEGDAPAPTSGGSTTTTPTRDSTKTGTGTDSTKTDTVKNPVVTTIPDRTFNCGKSIYACYVDGKPLVVWDSTIIAFRQQQNTNSWFHCSIWGKAFFISDQTWDWYRLQNDSVRFTGDSCRLGLTYGAESYSTLSGSGLRGRGWYKIDQMQFGNGGSQKGFYAGRFGGVLYGYNSTDSITITQGWFDVVGSN